MCVCVGGVATEVHFDEENILTKGGHKSQIGICGFAREKINRRNEGKKYLGCAPIAWYSGESDGTSI